MIDLVTDEFLEHIDNALSERRECIVATASRDGQPDLGPKGSVMVFDPEHLAFWERMLRATFNNLAENPRVVIYYADPPSRTYWRFYGTATLHKEGPIREEIMARTVQAELDRDPERQGYGVLVRVDRVATLGGNVLQEREGA
jgi:predicted pyridoxine 5'-phosphate oxidase superfamily flavin-nucleotide-binding protein